MLQMTLSWRDGLELKARWVRCLKMYFTAEQSYVPLLYYFRIEAASWETATIVNPFYNFDLNLIMSICSSLTYVLTAIL